jgi:alpha-D-ribose 1-methylphosphonate 5-triphosphate synthase subunit PhnL
MNLLAGATLIAEDVSKSFRRDHSREDHVLHGVDLEISPGALVVIEGEVGSGRSTLIRCLLGTYRVDGGSIVLRCDEGSVNLTTAADRTIAWLRERYISSFDGQLLSPPHFATWRTLARFASLDESHARDQLGAFGAGDLGDVPFGRLLAAEARVVALTTALSRQRSFYLLDEPLLGQGDLVQRATISAVNAARSKGAAVVVTATPTSPWTDHATSHHQLQRK